jgi:signal peptidase
VTEAQPQATTITPGRRVGRVLGIAGQVLLALLVLLLIFLAYGTIDNRWYHTIAITGGSMEPTIAFGDAIIITRPPAQLEPGMIVTIEGSGTIVTHRLLEARPDGTLVTKGDANEASEEWAPGKARVAGLYRLRVPYAGYLWIYGQRLLAALQPKPFTVEWTPAN